MSINKNMNSLRWYMYKTSIGDKDKVSIGKNCRAFGFLDGYFDEVTYENYFEKNDENKANYEKGFIEGVNERLVTEHKVLVDEKKDWVIKLAIYDGKNNIDQRNFSKVFNKLYLDVYYKSKYTNPKNIQKYMYTTEIINGNEEMVQAQCYVFGYLNGYFDEITYDCYLASEENKEIYELGYVEGINDRNYDLKKAKLEKLKWLIKLADYDAKNNIKDRIFSVDAMKLYDIYYEDFKDAQEKEDKSMLMIDPERLYNGYFDEDISNNLSDEEYFRFRHNRSKKYENSRKYFN